MQQQDFEPFALDAKTAQRVGDALSFDKLNRAHSDGQIDNASYADIVAGLARMAYPGDPQALSKFLKLHAVEMAEKLRGDYARSQFAGATGNGIGIKPLPNGAVSNGNGVWALSAADATKRFPSAINKANVDELVKAHGITFDEACSRLGRGS
jgi:hypothetical protein